MSIENKNNVCYRPNHDDFCRDCYMGGSDSDLEVIITEDIEEIKNVWSKKLFEDHFSDQYYASWEITFLINGKETTWEEWDTFMPNLNKEIEILSRKLIEDHEEKTKQKLLQQEANKLKEATQKELEQYLKLKEKYG